MTNTTPHNTARHKLPLLMPAQALKYITHNEALIRLDSLVSISCASDGVSVPPSAPQEGDVYIVPTSSEWGHAAGTLVTSVKAGWDAQVPVAGLLAYIQDRDALVLFTGENWRNLNEFTAPNQLGINTQADATNRLAVSSPATLLNHVGNGHQLKINKAAPSDTASIIFQTGFSARAEIGLTGTEDFSFKTSPDGEIFEDAIQINTSGHVAFPKGLNTDLRVERVANSGGPTNLMGPMSLQTVPLGRETLSLTNSRIYFSAFHVDRSAHMRAAHIARTQASSDTGALIRCGLFRVGEPIGNSWKIGERLLDYGTCDATQTGHYRFDLGEGLMLERGWYMHAIGCDGADVNVRALQWLTPGLAHYVLHGSGSSCDFRLSGVARLVLSGIEADALSEGFPATWSQAFTDVTTTAAHVMQTVLPEWEPA